jgi:hypothetical protein
MSRHLSTTPESVEGRPDPLPREATAPAVADRAPHGAAAPTAQLLRRLSRRRLRLLRRRRFLWRLRGDRFTVTGHG